MLNSTAHDSTVLTSVENNIKLSLLSHGASLLITERTFEN